jgi:hypothetical protein
MPTQPTPATDSAAELHSFIGDDVTATFENDPNFVNADPTESASSDNLEEQRPGAGQEFQAAPKSGRGAGPDADEEDEFADDEDDEDLEDEDDEEDDDLEDDDEDDEDLEDDDEEDEDDEEYEDDDEDLDEEDDDEDEDEDDADEVEASASPSAGVLRTDGLLGYEDEAEDTKNRVDRVTGDVERKRDDARKLSYDPDENPADAFAEVDPAEKRGEQVDSNILIRPVKPVVEYGAARFA